MMMERGLILITDERVTRTQDLHSVNVVQVESEE